MIRPLGPKELEMYQKYPATRWVREPTEHFVLGPKAIIEATEQHKKKAREFIKSDECRKLEAAVVEAEKAYDAARTALTAAAEKFCEAEKAHVDALWKSIRENRKPGWERALTNRDEQGEPPTFRFHDRNWVDEDYGWKERSFDQEDKA